MFNCYTSLPAVLVFATHTPQPPRTSAPHHHTVRRVLAAAGLHHHLARLLLPAAVIHHTRQPAARGAVKVIATARGRALNFTLLPTPTHPLTTMSAALVCRLYGLGRTLRHSRPVHLLAIRLMRRHLVALSLSQLSLLLRGVGSFLGYLWLSLSGSLDEVFSAVPGDFSILTGDVCLTLPAAATPATWASAVVSFLAEKGERTHTLQSRVAMTRSQTSPVLSADAWALRWLFFCRAFLSAGRLIRHSETGRIRSLANFTLLCCEIRISFCRRSPSRRFRSIRRRLVKRATREAGRRLWPF